jgi:cephalosporin hydroxylase
MRITTARFLHRAVSSTESSILFHLITRIVTDAFHWIWYRSPDTWTKNTFLGYPIFQLPFDLWLYQELIYRERPRFIVQTGVAGGGSVLYFAALLDLIGASQDALVIGVDIALGAKARTLSHPRIRLIEGSSTDEKVVQQIEQIIPSGGGLVVLDSDHSCTHVLQELEIYRRFVGIGCHLVVEDTNVNGHPVNPTFGPGPFEAVEIFLRDHDDFARDDALWKRNLFSFHQSGWLLRTK